MWIGPANRQGSTVGPVICISWRLIAKSKISELYQNSLLSDLLNTRFTVQSLELVCFMVANILTRWQCCLNQAKTCENNSNTG